MDSNKPPGGSILKRSNLVIGDGSNDDSSRSSNSSPSPSQPILKKSKLSNRFDTLFADDSTSSSEQDSAKNQNSFLKPSKLTMNASNVFMSVQQSSTETSQVDSNTNPSEKFLSLTRSATINTSNKTDIPSQVNEIISKPAEHQNGKEPERNGSSSKSEADKVEIKTNSSGSVNGESEQSSSADKKPVFGQFSATSTFTFGQDLHNRVTAASESQSEVSASGDNKEKPEIDAKSEENKTEESNGQSGSSESAKAPPAVLFGAANGHTNGESASKMGAQAQCKTGEENEKTVFQMNAKLFQYDTELKNWKERGQGVLKVNEESKNGEICRESVRIVMRTNATFQLILNTKIFIGQIIEKASEKAIKLSSMNDDQSGLTLYTIKGNPQNVDILFNLLDARKNLLIAKGESADLSWVK